MKTLRLSRAPVLGLVVLLGVSAVGQNAKPAKKSESFDGMKAGTQPAGWKQITRLLMPGEIRPDDHVWQVEADANAPSAPHVLRVVKVYEPKGYSVCWTDAVPVKDGTITARGRVDSAKIDGSAGLAWRVVDSGNFYVVRYNSLERNFRAYVFKDGKRTKTVESSNIVIPHGTWFTIKVVARGDTFECTLNDLKPIAFSDSTHAAGGAGFYVKQDGQCSFDDLEAGPPQAFTSTRPASAPVR